MMTRPERSMPPTTSAAVVAGPKPEGSGRWGGGMSPRLLRCPPLSSPKCRRAASARGCDRAILLDDLLVHLVEERAPQPEHAADLDAHEQRRREDAPNRMLHQRRLATFDGVADE